MCDTFVATGEATAGGAVILAKNSDRHPNEAHVLEHVPAARHEPGATLRCTHVDIPQVAETHEVILSRPFWTWGCEMGMNGRGVAIGNEAVFTRVPYQKGGGLLGMDLARLALERGATAREALDVIVDLLEIHSQGGNHGLLAPQYYHNSFLIADPGEAWVLETAGPFWVTSRVEGVRSISNGLTIGREWDLAGPGVVEHAIERGWCTSETDFHFARCYSNVPYTTLNGCRARQRRSTELLEAREGQITVASMMAALRDHGEEAVDDASWDPSRGWLMDTLCVHAGFGPTRPVQSTGAMVAHLAADLPTGWLTGTSATCTSIFKPVYPGGAGLPDLGPQPGSSADDGSLWWTHERLHRAVIRDYAARMALYRAERDALEASFLREAAEHYETYRGMSAGERAAPLAAFTTSCFERARQATIEWIDRVTRAPVVHRPSILFSWAWNRRDRAAQGRRAPVE